MNLNQEGTVKNMVDAACILDSWSHLPRDDVLRLRHLKFEGAAMGQDAEKMPGKRLFFFVDSVKSVLSFGASSS